MTAPRDTAPPARTGSTVPIAAALSLVTGLILCLPGDFYLYAEQLSGRPFTPRDLDNRLQLAKLRVAALERWPQLSNETGAGINRENRAQWLAKRAERYGAELPL